MLTRSLALALLCVACAQDDRPDILLITLDTTRADRIGAFGDAAAHTPALDALAESGVVFERAYASAPRTLPSHLTMLTGLDPHEHGVHDNGAIVPSDLETAAQRLAQRGYDTAAFVAAFVLDESFGLSRGFGLYDDEIDSSGSALDFSVPSRSGAEVTDRALAWLEGRRSQPYFLWVHYYDPHTPRPSDVDDPYAAEITAMDAQIGRLLAAARRHSGEDRLVILAIGDHGEALGDHDEMTHGILAYDATLHVPLIAAGPGFPAGLRRAEFVQTRDVSPTLLAAAGEPALPSSGAVALQQLVTDGAPAPRTGYFESAGPELNVGWARIGGVRDGRWKYTAEPAPAELYDVEADPRERVNRIDAEPELAGQLAETYARMRQDEREAAPGSVSSDVREQLAALGYASAPVRFEGEAPDPRRLVRALAWLERARAVAAEGRVGDAIRALEALATHPALRAVALTNLAAAYAAAGRHADAADAYRALVTLTDAADYRVGLAQALLADGRPAEALAAIDATPDDGTRRRQLVRAGSLVSLGRAQEVMPTLDGLLTADPGDDAARALRIHARAEIGGAVEVIERAQAELATEPAPGAWAETRMALADLLSSEGRDAEAARLLEAGGPAPRFLAGRAEIAARHGNYERAAGLYERALSELPHEHGWLLELADAYHELGRLEDATVAYDVLLAADPDAVAVHLDRGVALYKSGRLEEAEASFRSAAELDPELAEAWFNLALVKLKAGDLDSAEAHLRSAVALRTDYAKAHFQLAQLYRERGDPRAGEHAELAARASGAP